MILDFRGGTYVSQVTAPSPTKACVKWAKQLDVSAIFGLGIKGKQWLNERMKVAEPIAIENVTNVWSQTASVSGDLVLLTFVATELD